MNAESKRADLTTDEIDLLGLLHRWLRFLRRYRWLFLSATILGLAWGIYRYYATQNTYRSRAVLHSSTLTNQENIQIADNWNELLRKREFAALAQVFQCSESIIRKLREIDASEIQKVFSPNNPNGFVIEVVVFDNAILPALQNGIVNGYESSPYIVDRLSTKRARLNEMIARTRIEIGKLDSTKREIANIIGGSGRASSSVIVDGASSTQQVIDLNERQLNYQEELKFARAVQVLQPFSAFAAPAGPNAVVLIVIGLIVAIALASIVAVLLAINSKLRTYQNP